MREPTDEDLLARTPSDPEAFAELYRRYERPLLQYFVRRTSDPESAADLTAETFAAALIAAERYRPAEGPAGAWLFGIARNKLLKSFGRQRVESRARRRLALPVLVLDDDLLAAIDRIDADDRAASLIAELPPDQAQAVEGRVIEELPYSTLAARLECSEQVARKRVSRGLAFLRRVLKEAP
jgi:RNA polymerase sigma factor (sigma-70 family)